jgi:hypothetical protein
VLASTIPRTCRVISVRRPAHGESTGTPDYDLRSFARKALGLVTEPPRIEDRSVLYILIVSAMLVNAGDNN